MAMQPSLIGFACCVTQARISNPSDTMASAAFDNLPHIELCMTLLRKVEKLYQRSKDRQPTGLSYCRPGFAGGLSSSIFSSFLQQSFLWHALIRRLLEPHNFAFRLRRIFNLIDKICGRYPILRLFAATSFSSPLTGE